MRKKIACVVQRYGLEVNGGAEYHCRVLAEHLADYYEVDVFTSCAKGYRPWDNYYKTGVEVINEVNVHRFAVEGIRDAAKFGVLTKKMNSGDKSVEDEWIKEIGPYCPTLIEHLKENANQYEAVIFFTYVYYFTVTGLKLELKNSILLPTAHDEPTIYFPIYADLFKRPKAILYNSVEERELLRSKFGTSGIKSRLTCVGIDIPEEKEYKMPKALEKYKDDYMIYVGRVTQGKGFDELNKYFLKYKAQNASNMKLIVVGKIDNGMTITHSDDIIFAGYVTEEEKTALIKNARLLVMPSFYESLSLVILESMAVKRPVLVNGKCEVLKGQCIRSNAGLYYENYEEFEECLNYIVANKEAYEQMCENGFAFVKENYDWNLVTQNVISLIEELQE